MLQWLEDASNRTFGFNPCVMLHDLRLRMRSRTVFWVMFAFALLGSGAVLSPFVAVLVRRAGRPSAPLALQELGRHGMLALLYVLLTLVALALPAYAASGIAGERERQTLGVLRSTMLSASDVALGKFLATLIYAVMLLALSLPLASWCLLMGALSPGEVAGGYAIILGFAAVVAGIGTWLSALCRSVVGAVVATYAVLIGLFAAPALIPELWFSRYGPWPTMVADFICVVAWVPLVAISAWLFAVLARGMVARLGHMTGERAQAVLGVAVFALVMVTTAWAGPLDALELDRLDELEAIVPYCGLWDVFHGKPAIWRILWTFGCLTAVACLGAVRRLRLKDFRAVHCEDVFERAWRRIRSLRRASARA